jgi:hypothetical protein
MTRKDYRIIATGLSDAKPPQTNEAPNPNNYGELLLVWTRTVQAVAAKLKADNYNFDYARFYDACDCAY